MKILVYDDMYKCPIDEDGYRADLNEVEGDYIILPLETLLRLRVWPYEVTIENDTQFVLIFKTLYGEEVYNTSSLDDLLEKTKEVTTSYTVYLKSYYNDMVHYRGIFARNSGVKLKQKRPTPPAPYRK